MSFSRIPVPQQYEFSGHQDKLEIAKHPLLIGTPSPFELNRIGKDLH
jgi:hypothetical protein